MPERLFFAMHRLRANPGILAFLIIQMLGLFAFVRAVWGVGATSLIEVENALPSVSSVVLNNGNPVTLTPNATTTVNVNFTVTDSDGCSDVFTGGNVTTTLLRSGAGDSCSMNALNCYAVRASLAHNCSGGSSANATATFEVYYFAQATDASSSFPSENWRAYVSVLDGNGAAAAATSTGVELNTLLAIEAASSTNYGTVPAGQNTSGTNQTVPVKNAGNASTTIQVFGTSLISGLDAIPIPSQHYATSTFTFGGAEQSLTGGSQAVSGFLINKGPMASGWMFAGTTTNPIHQHVALARNRFLYVIGGRDQFFSSYSAVYRSALGADGIVGSRTAMQSLPYPLYNHSGAVNGGYFYVTGGEVVGVPTSSVLFTSVRSDGLLEGWNLTSALPAAVYRHGTAASGGYIYNAGGLDSAIDATSTVNFAPVSATGSVGPWVRGVSLPNALYAHSVVADNGYLYALGGRDAADILTSTVRFAPLSATGSVGIWSNTSALPHGVDAAAAVFDGGILYVAGGYTGQTTSSVYYAIAHSDGTLSPWFPGVSLPAAIDSHAFAVDNGYLYTVGGALDVTSTINVISASSRNTYWGIEIPAGTPKKSYTGTNTFVAVFSP